MKIILKNSDEELIISDDNFDGAGWVEIIVEDETGDRKSIEIHITDIMPALIAFNTKYEDQRKRDKEDEEI